MNYYTEQRIRTYKDGRVSYLNQDDNLHRIGGPAVIYSDGSFSYYVNGDLHREDGPAMFIFLSGFKGYYQHGVCHREDGPAKTWPTGDKEYWIKGTHISLQEFLAYRSSCNGKIVEIDGKKYKLTEV